MEQQELKTKCIQAYVKLGESVYRTKYEEELTGKLLAEVSELHRQMAEIEKKLKDEEKKDA